MVHWCIYLAAFLTFNVTYSEARSYKPVKMKTELQLLIVIFRHGDRTPEAAERGLLPEYTDKKETFEPIGLGQLTNQGKQKVYTNGAMLRKIYQNFLGEHVVARSVTAYSTDVERTKVSLMTFMAGMFPPGQLQDWGKQGDSKLSKNMLGKLWYPISYSIDKEIHNEMMSWFFDENYKNETTRVMSLPEVKKNFDKLASVYEYVQEQSKTDISPPMMLYLYSLFNSQKQFGAENPPWVEPIWPEFKMNANFVYESMFFSDLQKKLSGGPLLNRILDTIEAKANESLSDKKVFLYSCHDITVASVFAALGGRRELLDLRGNTRHVNYPVFGAMLILELHKILRNGEYAIKILYKNSADENEEPTPLKIDGCEVLCPLEQLVSLTKRVTTDNYVPRNGTMEENVENEL